MSLVLIVRMLPSLLLFPITGVVADRCGTIVQPMPAFCFAARASMVACMQQQLRVMHHPMGFVQV